MFKVAPQFCHTNIASQVFDLLTILMKLKIP